MTGDNRACSNAVDQKKSKAEKTIGHYNVNVRLGR